MATKYVRNWGHAENDGSTALLAKKSVQSCLDVITTGDTVNVSGLYIESLAVYNKNLSGVGFAFFDGKSTIQTFNTAQGYNTLLSNLTIKSYSNFATGVGAANQISTLSNINLINVSTCNFHDSEGYAFYFAYNLLVSKATTVSKPSIRNNCVFTDIVSLILHRPKVSQATIYDCYNNIFNNIPQLSVISAPIMSYSVFRNCAFKFSGGGLGNDEAVYTYPNGADDAAKIDNIRARLALVYGGLSSSYLPGCKYQTDGDLFIDSDNDNYYLVPGCQAAKMAFNGQWVGRYPEYKGDVRANYTTATNLDAAGKIIDQTVNAVAVTPIVDLGRVRHIDSFYITGEEGTRNGDAFNADSDCGAAINAGSAVLTAGTIYIVRGESITQTEGSGANKVRDLNVTFVANAVDGLSFTTGSIGYVQAVLTGKTRCIEAKVSKTDATLATAAWLKFDLNAVPYADLDANGIHILGNRDDGFSGTGSLLYARYVQIRATVNANNVPA